MSPQTLAIVGAFVGLGGCVSGAIEDTPHAGGAASQSGGAGSTTPTGGTGNPGGKATAGSSSSAGSGSGSPGAGSGGNGNTPTAGSSSSAGSSNNQSGSSNGSGGSGGTPGATHDCKRGIAWHGSSLDHPMVNDQLTWWYTWGLGVQSVGAGLEFVPMVWGSGADAGDVGDAIRDDAKFLLGYNEPNFFEQANMSAQQAAQQWPVLQTVAQQHGLQLVSPAVNYCGDVQAGTGPCHDNHPVSYLEDFFAACQGCQVDYVAVHWYNCDGDSLNSYLDLFGKFNKPLWVTELACAYGGDTSVAGQEKYMREAVPILEARTDVYRYSWFSGDPIPNARLLNGDGSPTALGQIYLGLPRDPTCTP